MAWSDVLERAWGHLAPRRWCVDTERVIGSYAGPRVRRDAFGWIAMCVFAAPGVVTVLWGAYRLVVGSVPAGDTFVVAVGDGPVEVESLPTRATVDLLFLVVWVLALNLLLPGLILGWIRVRRLGGAPWRGAVLLALGAATSVLINFWAWGRLSSFRTSGLLMFAGAAVALVSAYCLLRPTQDTAAPPPPWPGGPATPA